MKATVFHEEPDPPENAEPTHEWLAAVWQRKSTIIAVIAVVAILVHVLMRFAFHTSPGAYKIPLLATLVLGGIPLVFDLFRKLLKREFSSRSPPALTGVTIPAHPITSTFIPEWSATGLALHASSSLNTFHRVRRRTPHQTRR